MANKFLVQTLIFDKDKFKNKTRVRNWIIKSEFKISKPIDETSDSYRVRQINPKRYDKKSFRTFTITKGIKAVGGLLKLTPLELKKLKEHTKHHSPKHIRMMKEEMKKGKTFSEAHNLVKKKYK